MIEIYDENMELIEKPDLSLGWLEDSTRTEHHPALEGRKEAGHFAVKKEFPNGSREMEWIVDVPGVETKAAWDEKVPIKIYHEYTKEELENMNKPTTAERLTALEGKVEGMEQWEQAFKKGVQSA